LAEHAFDHLSQPGGGLGELVDVDALGEGAAVGVAQLGGDDAGWFFVGWALLRLVSRRHC
jgi:hypothetical protein